ncbi:MAG TPA: glycosyltransferase [Conexibacter sp.]|nr:glycosyltransferase [Conexibacter sp.]
MRRGLRIAVAPREDANGRYRAVLPLEELMRHGHTACWPGEPAFRVLEAGGVPHDWDVFYAQQMHDEVALDVMARLRRAGMAVVWDTDDDYSAVRRGTETWRRLGGRRSIRRHLRQMLAAARTAHAMTTTSERIAELYRDAGVERIHVVENYLSPRDLAHRRARHRGVVIGVTAATEHESDLRRLRIPELLSGLLARHDGVRVVAIGVDLRLDDHRYTHHPSVPIEQLVARESEFDVALAPLCDTAFNRARSNVKLKEYGAAGAMWLASPVGPFAGMGEQQGGLLVADDAWQATLEALLADQDRRRALAARARRWAEGQTTSAGAARWQAVFRDAVEQARAGGGPV